MLLAREGHAPFSGRLDGAFREDLFQAATGEARMRCVLVSFDGQGGSSVSWLAFCYCLCTLLASFHS
jgi:hypothetical protein